MVEVLQAGFYTSIQDLGRFNTQHYGVPLSGVMDVRAAAIANNLVGNKANAALLEMTMTGPKLQFNEDAAIAITGAHLTPFINGKETSRNKCIYINKGSILSFGVSKLGVRGYIAIKGGFKTKKVLGSRSMYKAVTPICILKKGTLLQIHPSEASPADFFSKLKVKEQYLKSEFLEVYKGPEFDCLSAFEKEKLLKNRFTISKNNSRMGYQLLEPLQNDLTPIITSPVLPGTVQLTPSGTLIVLMQDCQTTGGYPRVLLLTPQAITVLSQKKMNDSVFFKLNE